MTRRWHLTALLAVLVASGCSTTWFWEASVRLGGPMTATCIEEYLRTQQDVFDVVGTGNDGVAFRVRLPDTSKDDSPSISVTQSDQWNENVMRLSTSYETGVFASQEDKIDLRQRARKLATDITLACTGERVELGGEHPCGKGEPHDICVKSE